MNYLFQSARLGFRNWNDADIPKMVAVSADPVVMEYFPATARPGQTHAFLEKMKALFIEKGYCYFAVERLEDGQFIGFIGLSDKTIDAPFTPCVDIGWRLARSAWGRGYATEGAKRCLDYAFEHLGLSDVKATAPAINQKSIRVMQKIGMQYLMDFQHPNLLDNPRLVNCRCYEITLEMWKRLGNEKRAGV